LVYCLLRNYGVIEGYGDSFISEYSKKYICCTPAEGGKLGTSCSTDADCGDRWGQAGNCVPEGHWYSMFGITGGGSGKCRTIPVCDIDPKPTCKK